MLLGTVGNSLMKDVYIIINHDRGAILGTQGTLSWVLGSLLEVGAMFIYCLTLCDTLTVKVSQSEENVTNR